MKKIGKEREEKERRGGKRADRQMEKEEGTEGRG